MPNETCEHEFHPAEYCGNCGSLRSRVVRCSVTRLDPPDAVRFCAECDEEWSYAPVLVCDCGARKEVERCF